jgi:hypothetical protein
MIAAVIRPEAAVTEVDNVHAIAPGHGVGGYDLALDLLEFRRQCPGGRTVEAHETQ